FKAPGVGVMLQRKNGLQFDAKAGWRGAGFQLIKQAQQLAVLVQGVGALAVGNDMMRAALGVSAGAAGGKQGFLGAVDVFTEINKAHGSLYVQVVGTHIVQLSVV